MLLATIITLATPSFAAQVNDTTKFYIPKPNHGALRQMANLGSDGRDADVNLIRKLINTPSSVWVTSGTPKEAEQKVRQVTQQAAGKQTVPVIVLYNIPFRDCALYSAGGATSVAEYKAWIDGVVRGIENRSAYLILEPDGLGIIPWYTTLDGQLEWCQPQEVDPATAATERFTMMNYAVDQLGALPNTRIYLDATHGGWLNVGEITDRLLKAGVQNADGFFLNVSNYQWTPNLVQYGTWVSSCIAYITQINASGFGECGNQYWSGGPANNWQGVALDPMLVWSDDAATANANTAGINSRYASILGNVEPTTHFVADTSRNGQGPWTPTQSFPDPQTWCNPPARGLGIRPTTDTGNELVDAFLWVKLPGESDGQCSRGLGSGNNVVDPIWGRVDPAAGSWFPEQALELAKLANPPLQ
ncbi:MAG: glycoside hydrolase family 6 protein [Chloroflexi bacterium]|nr:glycoside hydrolase family 6 protein [Chloroflexota bacterium]